MSITQLRLINKMRYYANYNITPLKLKYVWDYGNVNETNNIVNQATFLHKELPIRLSQRAIELESLPYTISNTPYVQNVYNLYLQSFDKILTHPIPDTSDKSEDFASLISDIKETHNDIEIDIGKALHIYRNKTRDNSIYTEINLTDKILNNFYSSRIGIRFLIGQHVALQKESSSNNIIGIINTQCDPHRIIRDAGDDVSMMIDELYCKDIKIKYGFVKKDYKFLYISSHLHYIVFEILKNAARASIENNSDEVTIQTSVSKEDYIIKISDNGDGISRDKLEDIFSFTYSTASGIHQNRRMKLAGYGHGLGLSRLYARYFGGDLNICSVKGVGTDVYIYLNRFGNKNENIADINI